MHFLLFFTTELPTETATRPTGKIILYENCISVKKPSRVLDQQFARDMVIARWTTLYRTVLGDATKKPVNQNTTGVVPSEIYP